MQMQQTQNPKPLSQNPKSYVFCAVLSGYVDAANRSRKKRWWDKSQERRLQEGGFRKEDGEEDGEDEDEERRRRTRRRRRKIYSKQAIMRLTLGRGH
jgi:hypothetical protein